MSEDTIAIVAPGHMGHAIGAHLAGQGLRVITNLEGRSAETAARAARSGMEDVGSDWALVEEASMVLSILPPANAVEFARGIAAAARDGSKKPLFVDCNAISPATAAEVAAILATAGIACVDAAIRGGAPVDGKPQPRIYASGEGAERFAELGKHGLDIRVVGPVAGQASALKMCAAAISKGMVALVVESFICARALGIEGGLREEVMGGGALDRIARRAPNIGPDAYRWASEMDEIAGTMAANGLPPETFAGMAALCRFVEGTPIGRQTKETMTLGTEFESLIAALAEALPQRQPT